MSSFNQLLVFELQGSNSLQAADSDCRSISTIILKRRHTHAHSTIPSFIRNYQTNNLVTPGSWIDSRRKARRSTGHQATLETILRQCTAGLSKDTLTNEKSRLHAICGIFVPEPPNMSRLSCSLKGTVSCP